MQVDFNQLRRSIIRHYNDLVETAADVDNFPEEEYDKIKRYLRVLRDDICVLACLYDDESGIVSLADETILVAP